MKCPNCNAEMNEEDVFCKNCGFRQVIPKDKDFEEEKILVSDISIDKTKRSTVKEIDVKSRTISTIVILVVAAISIITIISCYLIYSNRHYNIKSCVMGEDVLVNTVTIDDVVIEIPQEWNYVRSHDETLFSSVLYKDDWNSYATILSGGNITFDDIENYRAKLLSSLEKEGFWSLSLEKATVNNVDYMIITGKKDKYDYFIIYINGTSFVYGAEGIYDTYDDLSTMVNFLTYINKVMNNNSYSSGNHYFDLIK